MKRYICRTCKRRFTEDDLSGLLPICECGDDLSEVRNA